MRQRVAPILVVTSLVLAAIFSSIVLLGCGASAREKILRTTFVSINAARDGFMEFDAQHQQQIVDAATSLEEGQAALGAYRQERERVLAAFVATYQVLAAAVIADDAKSLTVLLDAAKRLQQALDDLKQAKAKTP